MKKLFTLLMVVIMAISLATPITAEAAVKINKSKVTMEVDSTLKLKVGGTKDTVTWRTSKNSIATITKEGMVTAKSDGSATITATVKTKKYSCIITVIDSSREEIKADKGTITELTTGTYVIGEDFPAGKYNVKVISGSGNFFVTGNDTSINEILAEEGNAYWDTHSYNNLRLLYGDKMVMNSGLVLEFTKLD